MQLISSGRKGAKKMNQKKQHECGLELGRQVFHILLGFVVIAMLLVLGREITLAAVFFTLIIGTALINVRLLDVKIPAITQVLVWFEERFERSDAPLNGWGSACYATGVLLAITFLPEINEIAATILILGLGDGISTIVGLNGKAKLPYNKRKTLEGTIAFLVSSLTAYYFVGILAVPIALIAALVESLPYVDDNLTVPIVCTAFFLVFG
jgi:dolichol kinase